MKNAPHSDTAPRGFLKLSQVLTGEKSLDGSLATSFFDRLKTQFGESLDTLIREFETVEKSTNPVVALQSVLDADQSLARIARATLWIWYTGEFKPLNEVTDGPQTPDEYSQGLLWKVIRAHAPGYTNAGFEAWAKLPDPTSRPQAQSGAADAFRGTDEPPMQSKYNVVIVGSGVAGALLAYKLKSIKPKLSIAVLEAGDNGIEEADRARFRQVYALTVERDSLAAYKRLDAMGRVPSPGAGVDRTHLVQGGPDDFKSNYARLVGGSTWAWRGNCPRFPPNDFMLRKQYGIADNWPLDYGQLLDDYCKAEDELGVAGDSTEWNPTTQGDRGKPYPLPKIPQAVGDVFLKRALSQAVGGTPLLIDGREIRVIATPQARVTKDGWKDRRQCQGNASCIPICPTGAKYDAGVHIRLARELHVEFHPRCVVTRVRMDPDGKVVGVVYRTWAKSQEDQTVDADYVVLACNGIETPRLWLTSKLDNSRDLVGRNLMDHVQSDVVCRTPEPIYPFRGPQNTSSIVSFFDHPNRKTVSAFNISVGNDGWGRYTDEKGRVKAPFNILDELTWDAAPERVLAFGDALQRKLRDDPATAITHMLRLSFSTEQLPEPENRVALADEKDAFGVPRPKISYKISDYSKRSLAYARSVVRRIIEAAGMKPEGNDLPNFQYSGAGHLMGTCRMGRSKADSVVDSEGRSHVHPNVYLVGSSVFVTASCVNPTLTIAALTLRAAQALARQFP